MRGKPVLSGAEQGESPGGEVLRGGVLSQCLARLLNRYVARNQRLRVCDTLSLGGRRSVALIECDGQRFLAGMSASGVETLVAVADVPARGEMR